VRDWFDQKKGTVRLRDAPYALCALPSASDVLSPEVSTMSRQWISGRLLAPRWSLGEPGESAYSVRLSLLPRSVPLLLITTLGVVGSMTHSVSEPPHISVEAELDASATIDTMATTSDKSILATSDTSGKVHLWQGEGRRRRVLLEHPSHATCVAFARGGTLLAVGDVDSTVSLWDVSSGKMKWSAAQSSGKLRAIAFSRDGSIMASGGTDRDVYLWDTATRRQKARLKGHTGTVTAVAFAHDGQSLVTGSQDGTIRCWNAATGQARWFAHGHAGEATPTVFCIQFSPDGKTVATAANRDPAVRIWDSATGRELGFLLGTAAMITAVTFTPDDRSLVSGDCQGGLTIWDVGSRRSRLSWNSECGWIVSVAVAGNGRTLASAGESRIKLWQLSDNAHSDHRPDAQAER
jgi:WD40 repeat protein